MLAKIHRQLNLVIHLKLSDVRMNVRNPIYRNIMRIMMLCELNTVAEGVNSCYSLNK